MQSAGQKQPLSPFDSQTLTNIDALTTLRPDVPEALLHQRIRSGESRDAAVRECFISDRNDTKPLPEHILGSGKRAYHRAFQPPLAERHKPANQIEAEAQTQVIKRVCSAVRAKTEERLWSHAQSDHKENNATPDIFLAAKTGNPTDMALCLKHIFLHVDIKNNHDKTPIMLAASRGHHEVVKLLIFRRANLKQTNKNGDSLLALAAKNGKLETVSLLLGAGVKSDKKNHSGHTALMLAAENDHAGVVELLIQHNANFNEVNRDHETALILAAKNGHLAVVKTLVAEGAFIRAADGEGRTALAWATENGHLEVVRFLASL